MAQSQTPSPADLAAQLQACQSLVEELSTALAHMGRVEHDLATTADLNTTLLALSSDGLALCQTHPAPPHVRFLAWNPRLSQWTGLTRAETNTPEGFLRLFSDPKLRSQFLETVNGQGLDLTAAPWLVTDTEGTVQRLQLTTRRLGGPGEDLRVLILATDRVAWDEQYQRQLKRIAELETQLERSAMALTQAQAARHTSPALLADISHEIRTPLQGLLGLLIAFQSATLSQEQREYLHLARASGQHLSHLLDDISDLAHLETGQFRLNPRAFRLDELLGNVVGVYRFNAAAKGLSLVYSLSGEAPLEVVADSTRLRQILCNLLSSAVRRTQSGVVRLEVSGHPSSQSPQEAVLVFQVSDQGPGIPPDLRSQFIDPLEAPPTPQLESGLGLRLVQRLARLMGGQTQLDLASEGGARITCRLPVRLPGVAASRHGQTAPHQSPEPARESLRILVVEDDAINRATMRAMLWLLGHEVMEAETGQQALERIQATSFDLVLMDIQLPVMDGLAATRAIRDKEATTGHLRLPIIAVTAYAMPGDSQRFLDAGCDAYVPKPVELPELERAIALVMAPTSGS